MTGRTGPVRARRGLVGWLTAPLLLLSAGCTAAAGPQTAETEPPSASPFADCTALTAPPAAASGPPPSTGASAGPSPAAPGADLPDLTLPCFTGERPFRLTELRGPAVVNLWGTWCGPCRAELPAVQRLADRTTGRLHVLGVDTRDSRDAAGSFGTDLRITIPNLYDREERLRLALGVAFLPATVFIDAAGNRHVYNGLPRADAELAELVAEHAGVTVGS